MALSLEEQVLASYECLDRLIVETQTAAYPRTGFLGALKGSAKLREAAHRHQQVAAQLRGDDALAHCASYLEGVFTQLFAPSPRVPEELEDIKRMLEDSHTRLKGCYELGLRHALEERAFAVKMTMDIGLGRADINRVSNYQTSTPRREWFLFGAKIGDARLR